MGRTVDGPEAIAPLDATTRFVRDLNVSRVAGMLHAVDDPVERERLRVILIAEEDRFGSNLERLEKVEQMITDGRARIRDQKTVMMRLEVESDRRIAEKVLQNHVFALSVFEDYRRHVLDGLDRCRI